MQRLASKHQLGGYGSGHPCREVVSGLTFKAQKKAIVDPLTTRIANALTDLSIGELWGGGSVDAPCPHANTCLWLTSEKLESGWLPPA